MPAQVDGAGRDVDIHEVVNYSALYVVLDPVHQVPPPHINDLNKRKVPEHAKKQCEIHRFTVWIEQHRHGMYLSSSSSSGW